MKPISTKQERMNERGAALLLAMWAVITLSAAILIWAGYVRHTITVAGDQQNDTEARAQAHSGAWLALHPLVSKETPVLQNFSLNPQIGFRVQMISEGSKLNINSLLGGGTAEPDPRKMDLLQRWLESKGIDFNTRMRMIDCMLDWIDADNLKRNNGQEDTLGYHPPNRAFLEVDEMAQVAGMEALTSQPGWKDDLTVDSNGPIDLTSADFEILRLLPGLGDAGIERFLQWRRGEDGLDGTLDDPQIQKVEDVQSFLGLNKTQWSNLTGLVNIKDTTWRIISDGWSGNVHRQVEVVAVKGGQNPQIKRWKE
jgi:hypothetical protein